MFVSRLVFLSFTASLFQYSHGVEVSAGLSASYAAHRAKHNLTHAVEDNSTYFSRMLQFARRKLEVDQHNARHARREVSWKMAVNKFTDRFESEFRSLLGYKRVGRWWESSDKDKRSHQKDKKSFLQTRTRRVASSKDWRASLSSGKFIRQQGSCGSCWAVAAVGALEMHAEISSGSPMNTELSFKNLIDCTPNPQHCGGNGGCSGATAELAFAYVQEHGLSSADSYTGNTDQTDTCDTSLAERTAMIRTDDYVKLPTNELRPLMDAISNEGPVVVSVDGSEWGAYDSGVFHGCKQDSTINHAVLMVGYGTDDETGKDYWLIRNSWGEDWGESGFIRLERHDSDDGDAGYCGTDFNPKEGNACDGGPSTIPVCGMCGVLSDSSYPTGVKVNGF
eukprot:TRINITY_DN1553_c0_g2_i1.p1 TRINITY_DN1553_c0_g2~~TRINITY_DN1553_c0_g2_i1.p1  ORF type:complete len:393 (+),score=64.79 TRINITY_DN1553_c0_g2_i1:209-1387(+)